MNTSTPSSRNLLVDRARRNAELEELRERGLARQWQQLLAESGGKMPMTMEAWLAQQRALSEEDRRQQQDAFDNLHKFRGVGINELHRNKSHDSSQHEHLSDRTPDVIARTYLLPEYNYMDKKIDKCYTSKIDGPTDSMEEEGASVPDETYAIVSGESPGSSSPHGHDSSSIILSLGSESNMDILGSKNESITDWVELHSGDTCDTNKTTIKTNHEVNTPSEPNTSSATDSDTFSFHPLNILVSFGIISNRSSKPLVGSEILNDSKVITDILDEFSHLLERETNQSHCSYLLNARPCIISSSNDEKNKHILVARIPLKLMRPCSVDEVRDIRSSVGRLLGTIFNSK